MRKAMIAPAKSAFSEILVLRWIFLPKTPRNNALNQR